MTITLLPERLIVIAHVFKTHALLIIAVLVACALASLLHRLAFYIGLLL